MDFLAVAHNLGIVLVFFFTTLPFKNVSGGPIFVSEMSINNNNKEVRKGTVDQNVPDNYMKMRKRLLESERIDMVGGELVLTAKEKELNARLLTLKKAEFDQAHYNKSTFAPQNNFLISKALYEQSDIFKMIQKMPKGGALHVHDVSITDLSWLVQNATYRTNCYMCTDAAGKLKFLFFQTPPPNTECPWKSVASARAVSGNPTTFDQMLLDNLAFNSTDADKDINGIWARFEDILIRAEGLILYKPVFVDYYNEALREFQADNVQYIEVRALLPNVYNDDGTTLSPREVLQLYKDTTDTFKQHNPNFIGAKIIKTNVRFFNESVILDDIKMSLQLMADFPDYFGGYDLVGQEDPGLPLIDYLDALRYPSTLNPPVNLPYFFHAGETSWQGTRVDDNLLDAVLLNTTRIGHGYALTKHPEVMKIVKDNHIAVEINPISNQVLKLVDNLQNHPGASLIAAGYPVVISSDDPAVWGATGLSYDFYAAFMAMSGETDGLSLLKQLAMNSFLYSAMNATEKVAALSTWTIMWDNFVLNAFKEQM
ncbi:adenosine deaminase AGSA-like [Dreissena polymorpha]|uniref:adenosine deaminase n=1 Tax=Dreissena polymorpha TaxID=45954 RepID=A0A9D4S2R8_DREPO|nr:adenosine deaminase AGSA-like [Dreissena polymorpha]KAH3890399.1 hypothetical protein DPMN_014480 [Dreissena polymorpha]